MRKKYFTAFALCMAASLLAVEHPIIPAKNSDAPGSCYISSAAKTGISCIKNDSGAYVFRMDATDAMKAIYSNVLIKVSEGDTVALKLKIKGQGPVRFGVSVLDIKSRYIMARCEPAKMVTPEVTEYTASYKIEKNPKDDSAMARPAIVVLLFYAEKGAKIDLEKIEYDVQKGETKNIAIPEI